MAHTHTHTHSLQAMGVWGIHFDSLLLQIHILTDWLTWQETDCICCYYYIFLQYLLMYLSVLCILKDKIKVVWKMFMIWILQNSFICVHFVAQLNCTVWTGQHSQCWAESPFLSAVGWDGWHTTWWIQDAAWVHRVASEASGKGLYNCSHIWGDIAEIWTGSCIASCTTEYAVFLVPYYSPVYTCQNYCCSGYDDNSV